MKTIEQQYEDASDSDYEDLFDDEVFQEKVRIEGSLLFKNLLETSMIENLIDDEMYEKRIWLLRKFPMTITHKDINFYMNQATDEEINQAVAERIMELADA